MKRRILIFLTVIILSLSALSVFAFATEAQLDPIPEVTAQRVVLLNLDTNASIYSKAENEKAYPASLTKLVTLLVATDMITDYKQIVTASKSCYDDLVIGSSNIGIEDGEQFVIEDLLYAVAISSANEAANALAIHLCGSVQAFVDKMNEKASALGAANTHFVNTHGLHDENHYTTAKDMSLIAKAAFENENIIKYLSTASYKIPPTNKKVDRPTLITTNSLLRQNSGIYYKYCKAGKTGTTTAAGYNLISIAQKGDSSFLLVAMNSPKGDAGNPIFEESRALYNWAFDNYTNSKVLGDSEIITEVEVKLSAKGDHLVLIPQDNIYAVIANNLDITTLERELTTQQEILAPVKQGDVLGTITLKKDGVVYGTTNLIASDDVERSTVLYYLYLIQKFFENIWVRVICIILIAFLIIYIILMISQNKRRRRKKLKTRIRF